MNTRYCPSCGKGTPYEVSKPRFCGNCGTDMNGAFGASSKPATSVSQPYTPPVAEVEPRRKIIRDARGNDITHRFEQPVSRRSVVPVDPEGEESEHYDPDEAHAQAQELAASLDPSGFSFGTDKVVTRLGDLDNVKKAIADMQAAAGKGGKKRGGKRS